MLVSATFLSIGCSTLLGSKLLFFCDFQKLVTQKAVDSREPAPSSQAVNYFVTAPARGTVFLITVAM